LFYSIDLNIVPHFSCQWTLFKSCVFLLIINREQRSESWH